MNAFEDMKQKIADKLDNVGSRDDSTDNLTVDDNISDVREDVEQYPYETEVLTGRDPNDLVSEKSSFDQDFTEEDDFGV